MEFIPNQKLRMIHILFISSYVNLLLYYYNFVIFLFEIILFLFFLILLYYLHYLFKIITFKSDKN